MCTRGQHRSEKREVRGGTDKEKVEIEFSVSCFVGEEGVCFRVVGVGSLNCSRIDQALYGSVTLWWLWVRQLRHQDNKSRCLFIHITDTHISLHGCFDGRVCICNFYQ